MTLEERERLADLLERFIADEKPMLDQIAKLGPVGEPLAKQEKQRLGAAMLLITYLRSRERQTLGNSSD